MPQAAAPGIRPGLFYGVFAVLVATNVVAGLGLLMSPDIAGLINGRMAATVSSYEDRLAQLRLEVDKLHSRQYAQTGDINLELQELAQQQEVLAEQHQYVKALADKAAELGIGPVAPATSPSPAPVPLAPQSPTLTTGDAGREAIEQAGHQVRAMMDDSRTALAAISAAANSSADDILTSLQTLGIKPDMPARDGEAMGGPLLPPQDDAAADPTMVDDANTVAAALTRFKDARDALAEAPIHLPVSGRERISSPFGNRVDPFTGRLAFHPGIDFPWPTGTAVMASGEGKVIFVGQINGYGNCVDIDHGGGIVTRYGHLSAFIARQGDLVHTGSPIARVGSTGRSTGPHLHFEVRRNDKPVDPTFYIALGKRLARFTTAAAPPDADAPAPADASGDGSDSDAG